MNRVTRAVAGIAVCLAVAGSALMTSSGTAGAAAAGWRWFDIDRYDRCNGDVAVWYDAYGRMTSTAWFDLNNDCQPDSWASDLDGNGTLDKVLFDHYNPGDGLWDVMLYGNYRYDSQTPNGYGLIQDPWGNSWKSMGMTSTTLGGSSVSTGTSAGAFWNLMNSLAAKSGVPAWGT